MIKTIQVHECDIDGCESWEVSKLPQCRVCGKEVCNRHLQRHLILSTRLMDVKPLAAFPVVCTECVGNFGRVKPKAFSDAMVELLKDPANLLEASDG